MQDGTEHCPIQFIAYNWIIIVNYFHDNKFILNNYLQQYNKI